MMTLIVFIILLSILVLVHELGHFLAAKKLDVKVEEFGLGYPPKIIGKKIGETIYSLNALPFGGFVRLYGEESAEQNLASKTSKSQSKQNSALQRAFFAKSKFERSIILLAGVVMNFLLGVVVISYIFTQGVLVPTNKVMVQEVLKNSPAFFSGIKTGDQIVSIDGIKIKNPQDLITVAKQKAGKSVVLLINRCDYQAYSLSESGKAGGVEGSKKELPSTSSGNKNCRVLTLSLIPRVKYPANEGSMGVAISNLAIKKYAVWEAPFFGTIEAFKLTVFIAKGIGQVLWQLLVSAKVPEGVAGPIGIYQVTGQAVKLGGLMGVLQLLGLLSLNLAVVNILPIPALDGGKLFLILVETVVGRKRVKRIEGVSQSIGVALILLLIVLITLSDLSKLAAVRNLLKNLPKLF